MLNLTQSPDIGQNSDKGITDFPISGNSVIKENCQNSRSSDDIDMKLGPIIKLDMRSQTTSKKIEVSRTVTSLSFSQFMAKWEKSRSRIPNA